VWREENDNTLYRFRVLQNVETGKYSVYGCAHIHRHDYENVSIQQHQEFAFRQALFAQGLGREDEEMFDSIEEAIADFESE
jgi:hypothetical protein